jgi:zinc D-Ala-D-Ala carboxypeptidase
MSDNLSEHFTFAELTASTTATRLGLRNVPDGPALYQLTKTAEMLERVRFILGNVPITVTSAYRSPEVNKAVGGRTSSDHCKGMAADIVAPRFGTPYEVAAQIAPHVSALGVGQLILEGVKGKQWVHLSIDPVDNPINRIITITDAGTKPGIVELA